MSTLRLQSNAKYIQQSVVYASQRVEPPIRLKKTLNSETFEFKGRSTGSHVSSRRREDRTQQYETIILSLYEEHTCWRAMSNSSHHSGVLMQACPAMMIVEECWCQDVGPERCHHDSRHEERAMDSGARRKTRVSSNGTDAWSLPGPTDTEREPTWPLCLVFAALLFCVGPCVRACVRVSLISTSISVTSTSARF